MELFVVFGQPGSGKTFVGEILQKDFGFFAFEADQDMPEELRTAIERQEVIGDTLRDAFFIKLIEHVKQLQTEHKKLVITQTFIKEKYRKQFLQSFPQATFILVEADSAIREERLVKRKEWQLSLDYWKKMFALFEAPQIAHKVVSNNTTGEEEIKKQLELLIG